MATFTCPAGHPSTTGDYCDTCGAPIAAASGDTGGETTPPSAPGAEAPVPSSPPGGSSAAGEPGAGPSGAGEARAGTPACPSCGEPVLARYCESCGYDVESGTPAGPPPVTLVLGTDRAHWDRMVGSGEPAFPTVAPTLAFELTGDRAVLGRVRAGATADVDLALTGAAADPAVSHRQCVFERDADGWTVRDADSSNGTWINDADEPLAPGAVHRLRDGDRILVGAWTSLTVRSDRAASADTPAPPPSGDVAAPPDPDGAGSV